MIKARSIKFLLAITIVAALTTAILVSLPTKPDLGLLLFNTAAAEDLAGVKSSLRQGAPINYVYKTMFSYTPLMMAISGNSKMAVIRYLIESGADVNLADRDGNTPLMAFVSRNDDSDDAIAVVKLMIAYGANVNAKRGSGSTVFDQEPISPRTLAVLEAAREAQNESSPATRP
jgi:hypothetical protein